MLSLSGIPRYFSRLGRFCYCKKGCGFLFYAEEQVAVGRERPELLGGYRLSLVADGAQGIHLAEDNVSDIVRRFGDILDSLELCYLAVKSAVASAISSDSSESFAMVAVSYLQGRPATAAFFAARVSASDFV